MASFSSRSIPEDTFFFVYIDRQVLGGVWGLLAFSLPHFVLLDEDVKQYQGLVHLAV